MEWSSEIMSVVLGQSDNQGHDDSSYVYDNDHDDADHA